MILKLRVSSGSQRGAFLFCWLAKVTLTAEALFLLCSFFFSAYIAKVWAREVGRNSSCLYTNLSTPSTLNIFCYPCSVKCNHFTRHEYYNDSRRRSLEITAGPQLPPLAAPAAVLSVAWQTGGWVPSCISTQLPRPPPSLPRPVEPPRLPPSLPPYLPRLLHAWK